MKKKYLIFFIHTQYTRVTYVIRNTLARLVSFDSGQTEDRQLSRRHALRHNRSTTYSYLLRRAMPSPEPGDPGFIKPKTPQVDWRF
jgi:hypothetical protein